jgi:hypothetical protein
MLLMISAEWATVWAIAAGNIITLCTLIAVIIELRHLKKSIHSSTYQRIYEQMISIDRFFIDNPSLKPYFYGSKSPITKNPLELDKLDSISEMMVDYFDSVYHQKDCMPKGTFPQFLAYMQDLSNRSPHLRTFLDKRKTWYPSDFRDDI